MLALPWGPIDSFLDNCSSERKLRLRFWIDNPPFLNLFFLLPDGWMDGCMNAWMDGLGGWMGGDNLPSSIFLKFKHVNKWDVLISNIALKVVSGFFMKSYEHFNFLNWEFLRRVFMGKTTKILICQKDNSAMQKFNSFFPSKKYDYKLGNMENT